MALAVLVAILLQAIAPRSGRHLPWWTFPVIELGLLIALLVLDPGRIDRRSRGPRIVTLALIAVMTIATLAGVIILMLEILKDTPSVTPTSLLGRGAALWVTNIIVFSFWYWMLDRGGPAERAIGTDIPPSFAFPENATPELVPDGWTPRYHDYLYLAFTNATAFSPTDTLPLQPWAKMAMLAESVISLATAIMVIARAVNVLPLPGSS